MAKGGLPVTEASFEEVLSLPIYPDLSDEDVEYVCAAIHQIVRENRR